MLDAFFLAYVHFFLVALPAFALAIAFHGATRAGLSGPKLQLAIGLPTVLLGLWAALAMYAARSGLFIGPLSPADPPYILIVLVGMALLIWALARHTPLGRTVTNALDDGTVIAFQIPHAVGFVFLVGWAAGAIPWQFALPAGLGDIWAGYAAWSAWRASRAGAPEARRKIIRANVIGILDFFVAVFTGVTTSAGFLQLWAFDAPNIVNLHPLAMFPAFFVPLFLGFHLISLSKLRHASGARAAAA